MLKTAPRSLTGLLLLAAITLYTAAPATAELEARSAVLDSRIMEPPALQPVVRISLTAAPIVFAALAERGTLPKDGRSRFGRELGRRVVATRRRHGTGGGLTLDVADHAPTPLAGNPHAGFVSAILASNNSWPVAGYGIGAWNVSVDVSAVHLGRAARVRPGDEVPSHEPRGIMQIALAF
jgi:hypothetical protein